MIRTHLSLRTVAGVLLAGILVPVYGHAQSTRSLAPTPITVSAADEARAVDDLFVAASASYFGGHRRQAREKFELAADRALEMGDVAKAARALLNAAIIANEQRDSGRDVLIARATRLAASPLLSDAMKAEILGQFVPVTK